MYVQTMDGLDIPESGRQTSADAIESSEPDTDEQTTPKTLSKIDFEEQPRVVKDGYKEPRVPLSEGFLNVETSRGLKMSDVPTRQDRESRGSQPDSTYVRPEVALATGNDVATTEMAFDIFVQRYAHLLRGLDEQDYSEQQVTEALDDNFRLLGHQIVQSRVSILKRLADPNLQLMAKGLEESYTEASRHLLEAGTGCDFNCQLKDLDNPVCPTDSAHFGSLFEYALHANDVRMARTVLQLYHPSALESHMNNKEIDADVEFNHTEVKISDHQTDTLLQINELCRKWAITDVEISPDMVDGLQDVFNSFRTKNTDISIKPKEEKQDVKEASTSITEIDVHNVSNAATGSSWRRPRHVRTSPAMFPDKIQDFTSEHIDSENNYCHVSNDFAPSFLPTSWRSGTYPSCTDSPLVTTAPSPTTTVANTATDDPSNTISLDSIGQWSRGPRNLASPLTYQCNAQPKLDNDDTLEVILLGDSIVRGVRPLLNGPSITWCYPGISVERLTSRIRFVLGGTTGSVNTRSDQPTVVVLHVGTNDLGLLHTEEMMCQLLKLIREVRSVLPSARVVVSAVLQRFDHPASWRGPQLGYRDDVRVGWTHKVAEVVQETRALCVRESVQFVDAGDALSRNVSNNYYGNGLHLSKEGSAIMSAVLHQTVCRVLQM